MRNVIAAAALVAAGVGTFAGPLAGQDTTAAAAMPDVGQMAPDFAFHGVTRYGPLQGTQHLSDFRGETVVLWFFVRARTRG